MIGTRRKMEIVYLDQNKWVELARVRAGKVTSGPISDLYPELVDAVEARKVLFPLSASHVLETSKRNDLVSRVHLAETQAALSRGFAYRSRAGRLHVEVRATLHRLFGKSPPPLQDNWAIASSFLEAFEPMDSMVASDIQAVRLARMNAFIDPATQYVDYMKTQDDLRRRMAHTKVAEGTAELVARIEERRTRLTGETVDLRRRAYAAILFIEHQDIFLRVLNDLGHSIEQLKAMGDQAVRALVEDVPTLDVEAEMAARLESESGAVKANDVFDIQSFYTAIPYSSWVVAEKASISRARQAKLDAKYRVRFSQSLGDLLDVYPRV
jgi:hypothetical protein